MRKNGTGKWDQNCGYFMLLVGVMPWKCTGMCSISGIAQPLALNKTVGDLPEKVAGAQAEKQTVWTLGQWTL